MYTPDPRSTQSGSNPTAASRSTPGVQQHPLLSGALGAPDNSQAGSDHVPFEFAGVFDLLGAQ